MVGPPGDPVPLRQRFRHAALVPEDPAFTRYAVDRDGQTLLAQTFDIGDPPYARTVQVLDEMMSSLEFLGES